ncbi:hypothetical protein [Pseudooceanicola marinus]|nr:hypothetical protein [Pseudooceanicola marinus]
MLTIPAAAKRRFNSSPSSLEDREERARAAPPAGSGFPFRAR